MTAPRRLLAAAVGMSILVAFALLLWQWLPGPAQTATAPAVPAMASAVPAAPAVDRGSRPLPPPRLLAAAGGDEAPPAMPEGLAQDLAIFDGPQLRAELESIALSYPEVRVVEAVCSGLPCRAEAAATSADQLSGFTLAVHHRFQGHVSIRTQRMAKADPGAGPLVVRATFWVGTTPGPPPAASP